MVNFLDDIKQENFLDQIKNILVGVGEKKNIAQCRKKKKAILEP